MKISFYSPSVLNVHGGTETFIKESVKHLTKYCNVEVVAGTGSKVDSYTKGVLKNIKVYEYDYITRKEIPTHPERFAMECLTFFPYAYPHFLKHKYDLIHANYPTDCILKSVIDIPLVIHFHGEGVLKSKLDLNMMKKFKADKYLACSKYIAEKINKKLGLEVQHVYNGVDPVFFSPKYKKVKKDNRLKVFTIGRLVKNKGFDVLIKAFKYVEKKDKKIDLLIGGIGPHEPNLRSLARKLRLRNVKFVGFIPQNKLPMHYANADVFVNPRIAEPFGIVFLEAMACATPVIGGKQGGPKEFVTKDVGFLADNSNPKDIARKILEASESDLGEMGRKSRKIVEKKFTWDKIAKDLYRVYKNIC